MGGVARGSVDGGLGGIAEGGVGEGGGGEGRGFGGWVVGFGAEFKKRLGVGEGRF